VTFERCEFISYQFKCSYEFIYAEQEQLTFDRSRELCFVTFFWLLFF